MIGYRTYRVSGLAPNPRTRKSRTVFESMSLMDVALASLDGHGNDACRLEMKSLDDVNKGIKRGIVTPDLGQRKMHESRQDSGGIVQGYRRREDLTRVGVEPAHADHTEPSAEALQEFLGFVLGSRMAYLYINNI